MPAPPQSFEQDARDFAVVLERRRWVFLAVLSVFYALGAVRHAASKPLWYDEVITVIASSAPDAASTWKIAQSTDASPPLPHLLTHFAMQWFGSGEVAIRMPAIIGFWVFCLCLFAFVRRRVGIYFGFMALLIPVATEAYAYSFEARAYGPELALCGLTLVGWQAAADGRWRRLGCVLMGTSLALAMLCHYYAILLYMPLGAAELLRSRREHDWNWAVWAALAVGVIPLVWRIATVSFIVKVFSQTTWAPAYLQQTLEYWELVLPHCLAFLVLGLGIWGLRTVVSPGAVEPAASPKLAAHEVLAAVLFLAIPTAAVLIGVFKTHMFTPRYALIGVTGFALLVPMMASRLAAGRAFAGFLMLGLSLLPLGLMLIAVPEWVNPTTEEATLIQALQEGPVVVPDGQLFMKMWHYAPAPLKQKLLYLVDAESAVKYMGFDAIDVGIDNLRGWASVPVIKYKDFATPGREFRVYQNPLRPGWVLAKVVADGGSAQVEQYANFRQLFRVRVKP